MKIIARLGAAAAAGVMAGAVALAGPAHASLTDDIDALPVAAEQRDGYDRELFGDYDRDGLLDDNQTTWPECGDTGGYYSHADDTCHDESGDVHVDHIVALAEAWDSGAHSWSKQQLDEFAGDTDNLWLMTGSLNQSKGADDAAEWLPSYEPAVCPYVTQYVDVKVEWELSVDQAERDALLAVAEDCDDTGDGDGDGNGNGDGKDGPGDGKDGPGDGESTEPPADASDGQDDELAQTGLPTGLLAGAAVAIAALGIGLHLLSRRRPTRFTA